LGRNGSLETSDHLGGVVLVKLFQCGVEFLAYLSAYQKLGDLLAPLHILRSNLSHLSLVGSLLPVHGTEGIIWEPALVIFQGKLGFLMPDLAFLVGKVLPSETDDLGEGAVTSFDLGGNVLILDEGGTEEDEGVWGTGDMVFRLPLVVT
jgi:hypothetical protein